LLSLQGLLQAAVRSRAWVSGRSLGGIANLNPVGGHGCLFLGSLVVLSGRGLCVGLITWPEESYRLCCVWVWSWNLNMRRTWSS